MVVSKPYSAIQVQKVANQGYVNAGETESYHITVTNQGNETLYDVDLYNTLPAQLTNVSADPTWSDHTDTYAHWHIGALDPGQAYEVRLTVSCDITAAAKTILDNTVSVDGIDSQGTILTDSDRAAITVTEKYAAIDVEKVALSGIIENNREESYLITVTNNGNQSLSDVVLTDTIPEFLNYVESDPEGDVSPGGTKGIVTWDSSNIPAFALLPPGRSVDIRLTLRADTDASFHTSRIDNIGILFKSIGISDCRL
ncbi:MAG: DUF11 domain-containing protein [bacterium]|nr:DUF11 domain-containing protein [bacterium]